MSGPLGDLPFGIMGSQRDGQSPAIGTVYEGFPAPQSQTVPSPQLVPSTVDQVADGATRSGPVVTSVENFEAMSHNEMTARVVSFTPSAASDFSTAWGQFSRSIDAATASLEADIGSRFEDGFEGLFPDSVRKTHQEFINRSKTLADAVASPSDKLGNFADILNTVQNRFALLSALMGPDLPFPAVGTGLPRPSPQLTALMDSTYSPAVLDAGSQLPTLPGPFDMGPGGDQVTSGGLRPSSGGAKAAEPLDGGAPQYPGDKSNTAASAASTTAARGGQSFAPTAPHLENGTVPGGADAWNGRPANDAAITRAGLSPAPDGAHPSGTAIPANRAAVPGGSASLGGGAVPLAGSMGGGTSAERIGLGVGGKRNGGGGGGGSANASRGFGGRAAGTPAAPSVSGGPTGTAKGGLVRGPALSGMHEGGTNNAMAGRRGGAGGTMMGGAGRGREQHDDAYNPAEFLTTVDNGDKLIGPLPRVVHPVIGDWGER